MKQKRKGRKIKHQTFSYKKKKNKVLPIIITILIVIATFFVGYSIGEPLLDFFNDKPLETSENPPETEPKPETLPPETTSITTVSDEETPILEENDKIFIMSAEVIDENSIKSAVISAKKQGFTALGVPMITQNSNFNYLTNNEIALSVDDVVVGTLTANEIATIIKNEGLSPVSYIYTLQEHKLSRTYENMTYLFEGKTTKWLDNTPSAGGKTWLSPYKQETLDYFSFIANEISTAGFEKIILQGLYFPYFRSSDVNFVGDYVVAPDRFKHLINVVNTFTSSVDEKSTKILVIDNAVSIFDGNSELFKPEQSPDTKMLAVIANSFFPQNFTQNEFNAKLDSLFALSENISPMFVTSLFTAEQLIFIENYLEENDITEFCFIEN